MPSRGVVPRRRSSTASGLRTFPRMHCSPAVRGSTRTSVRPPHGKRLPAWPGSGGSASHGCVPWPPKRGKLRIYLGAAPGIGKTYTCRRSCLVTRASCSVVLSGAQLLKEVWGPGYETAVGNLGVYMAKLRQKLEANPARPEHLLTEPGMGYRFQPAEQPGPEPDRP